MWSEGNIAAWIDAAGIQATEMKSETSAIQTTVSVVSHGQLKSIEELLNDLDSIGPQRIEVILTLNLGNEPMPFDPQHFNFPVTILRNVVPRGFGANHNTAFTACTGQYFCVVNPDIRLKADPFASLIQCLKSAGAGVVGPLVRNSNGDIEDSARKFPTPWGIAKKLILGRAEQPPSLSAGTVRPDWIAGMFMLFRASVFREIGGFDERYFLYYEDVDLCARLSLSGHSVTLCPEAEVVHDARRQSHREWRYLRWHIRSMTRFFLSLVFLRAMWGRIAHVGRNG